MATRKQQIESLAKMMKKIDIAMLATVGKGGYLVSRPLSTQTVEFDGERIWFMTEADSPKVGEIRRNPKVNVAYASKDANTYISAAGEARVRRDQALIDAFWNDAMKAFFPNGKDDPNLTLVEVMVSTVEYWDGPGSWIGKAATFLAARVTGNDDLMGENRIVDLATGRSTKPPGTDRPGKRRAPTPRKPPAKKASSRKAPAKKATAKKAPARKKVAKQASQAARKKAGARKTPAKKAAAGKKVARKRTKR